MSKPAFFQPHYRSNHRNLFIVDASKAKQSLQKGSHGDKENDKKKNASLFFCIAVAVMGFLTTKSILLLLFYILRNRVTNIDNNKIGPQLNPFDSNNKVPPANTRMSSSRMYQGLQTNNNNAGLLVVVENIMIYITRYKERDKYK